MFVDNGVELLDSRHGLGVTEPVQEQTSVRVQTPSRQGPQGSNYIIMKIDLAKSELDRLVREAQQQAEEAGSRGDGPFGALLVSQDKTVVVRAGNTAITTNNAAAHAEINLLAKAGEKLKTRKLGDYMVVVNAAPCSMCMSALLKAKVTNIVFGAPPEPNMDPYITPEELAAKSRLDVAVLGGILADECVQQIARLRAARTTND